MPDEGMLLTTLITSQLTFDNDEAENRNNERAKISERCLSSRGANMNDLLTGVTFN